MLLWAWLAVSAASAAFVAIHIACKGGEKMWIMDIVWPVTALWAGPFGAAAYLGPSRTRDPAMPAAAAKAATHCGEARRAVTPRVAGRHVRMAGFLTSYPVNVVLLRRGLKERM